MKAQSLFIGLALTLGIGIGWLIKPASPAPVASAGAETAKPDGVEPRRRPSRAVDEAQKGGNKEPRKKTRTVVIGGGEQDMTPDERAMQEKISNAMSDRQRKIDDKRIAELVAKLGLDAGQEAALREFFASRRDGITRMFSGESSGAADMTQFADSKLDELMTDVLTDQQQETYEEVKTAEREKKVESRALKDLGTLNGIIDIREDQKDAVYQVLYDDAGAKVDAAAASGSAVFSTAFGGGFGVDMDSSALHETAFEVGLDAGSNPSTSPAEAFRKSQEKRISAKVNRLNGVLDETQLIAYREHLESQSKMFESFMPTTPEE